MENFILYAKIAVSEIFFFFQKLSFKYNSNIHNYNTRNKNKLRSAIGRHKFIYKNFRYISVHIWNNITDKIDTDTSLLTFKKQLKVLLFTDEITIPLES